MLDNHEVPTNPAHGNGLAGGSDHTSNQPQIAVATGEAEEISAGWAELEIKKIISRHGAAFVVGVVERYMASGRTCRDCVHWDDRGICRLRAEAEVPQLSPHYGAQCSLFRPMPF